MLRFVYPYLQYTMSKIGERQIILLDVCQGLLARLYNLSAFQLPAQFDDSLRSVCSFLVKQFPAYPDGVERVPCSHFSLDPEV